VAQGGPCAGQTGKVLVAARLHLQATDIGGPLVWKVASGATQRPTTRWQSLFGANFEVLLYDLTSTYFECDPPGAGNRL
jgi:hypothetical protein